MFLIVDFACYSFKLNIIISFFLRNVNIYIIIYIHITLIYFFNTLSYYTIPFRNIVVTIVGIFPLRVTIIRK